MISNLPAFLTLSVDNTKQAWCVDGRPDLKSVKGPQMLGASLHPVALKAIYQRLNFNETLITDSFQTLRQTGFALGVHRGSHQHEGVSDCGFADRMLEIILKAQNQQAEITSRLLAVYRDNQAVFESQQITESGFSQMLSSAFTSIQQYSTEKIQIKGEALIAKACALGATVANLTGDHQEQVAFVNLKEGVTLNTNNLNRQGQQAFNLDLWMAIKQAEALGVDKSFALASSLILYQATEMVLVEDKSKPKLPIIIHQ